MVKSYVSTHFAINVKETNSINIIRYVWVVV